MQRGRLISTAILIASLTALVSCSQEGSVTPPPVTTATLVVSANLSGTAVATVVVDVTAPDIPTMLVFNIPISNGSATGTITVPAGSNRAITIRGYDAGGVQTHSGTTTVSIQPGTNQALSIMLTPLTGDLPITATLGAYVVTVAPSTATLHLGGTNTAQLGATILDTQNHPVVGVVAWATQNPGVATVDGTGLVTGIGTGSTTISAVYQGVTGTATITVSP